MQKVSSPTIKISNEALKRGVVFMDLSEYHHLQERSVPTYYLTGKAAVRADRMVEEGLREYRAGKTIKAPSLKDALRAYEQRHARRRV